MTIMERFAASTLWVRIMKCDQLIYRSMVNKSQEKTKNSRECWNMKLRWMDLVDKRPNLLLPLIECLRHKVYCRLFLSLHPSVCLLGMVNSCIIAHSLFTLSSWKGGVVCKTPPPPFKPTPNFDHPLLIHSSYSSGHYQRLNLYFLLSLSLYKPPPNFSLSSSFLSLFRHTQRFHIISIEFFVSFLSLSPSERMTYFATKKVISTTYFYFHTYISCWVRRYSSDAILSTCVLAWMDVWIHVRIIVTASDWLIDAARTAVVGL